jgi:hypothetical protein
MYEKFKNLKAIKDPKVRRELRSLLLKRKELLEKREEERIKQIKEQDKKHNKYLPKYLSAKILNAVGFVEYTRSKGHLDMKGMVKFLETEKKFSQKEICWVLLLLSIESIEEILGTPEIGGKIQEAILNSKKTLH